MRSGSNRRVLAPYAPRGPAPYVLHASQVERGVALRAARRAVRPASPRTQPRNGSLHGQSCRALSAGVRAGVSAPPTSIPAFSRLRRQRLRTAAHRAAAMLPMPLKNDGDLTTMRSRTGGIKKPRLSSQKFELDDRAFPSRAELWAPTPGRPPRLASRNAQHCRRPAHGRLSPSKRSSPS